MPGFDLSKAIKRKLLFTGSTCGIMPVRTIHLNLSIIKSVNSGMVYIKDANDPNGPVLQGRDTSTLHYSKLYMENTEQYPNGCLQTVVLEDSFSQYDIERTSLRLRLMCPTLDPRIPEATCDFQWQTKDSYHSGLGF
jgi:hypothetical protein